MTSSEYTRPEQVQQTIDGLKKDPVKYVYWQSILDMPSEAGQGSSHLAPLRAYLAGHYQRVKTVEGDDYARTFWEKVNPSAPIPLPPPIPLPAPEQNGASPAGSNGQGSAQPIPLDTPAQGP